MLRDPQHERMNNPQKSESFPFALSPVEGFRNVVRIVERVLQKFRPRSVRVADPFMLRDPQHERILRTLVLIPFVLRDTKGTVSEKIRASSTNGSGIFTVLTPKGGCPASPVLSTSG